MNMDLVIGGFVLGLVSLVARFIAPNSNSGMFRKLGPMQERFGKGPGAALHWAAYTVAPLAFGGLKLAQVLLPASGQ